jgi:hypothetical protein
MSDDPLKRARQALQRVEQSRGTTTPAVRSNADALLARARAVAEGQHRPSLPVPPPPAPPRPAERTPMQTASAPVVEKVRIPMTCGASGGAFIVTAERRGNDLLLLGNEAPQSGRGMGGTAPEKLSGAYNIGWSGWSCPLCRTPGTGWICGCPQVSLQCGGTRGSRRYCACGRLEDRHLVQADAGVEVRGQSLGATTGAGPSRASNLPTRRKGR